MKLVTMMLRMGERVRRAGRGSGRRCYGGRGLGSISGTGWVECRAEVGQAATGHADGNSSKSDPSESAYGNPTSQKEDCLSAAQLL